MAEGMSGIACVCDPSNRGRWMTAFESAGAGRLGIRVIFPGSGSFVPEPGRWLVFLDTCPIGIESILSRFPIGDSTVATGLLRSAPPGFLPSGLPMFAADRIRALPPFISGRWFRAIASAAAQGHIGRLAALTLRFGPAEHESSQDPDSPAARAALVVSGLTGRRIRFNASRSGASGSPALATRLEGSIDGIDVPVSFEINPAPAPLVVEVVGVSGRIIAVLDGSGADVILESGSGRDTIFHGRLNPFDDAASAIVAGLSRNSTSFFPLSTVNSALDSLAAMSGAAFSTSLPGIRTGNMRTDFIANDFTSSDDVSTGSGTIRELKVFVSDACNLNCPFCFSRSPEKAAPSVDSFRSVFKDAVAAGYDSALLSGGEPTLNPDLRDIVVAARNAGMRFVGIETNAILLDTQGAAAELASAGLDRALVSFHSMDPETLVALTGSRTSLPRAIGGIRALLDAGIQVNINCVTTALNYRELPEITTFLSGLRPAISQMVLSFMAGLGSATDHPELYPRVSDAAPFLRRAIEIASSSGIDAVIPGQCGLPQCVLPDKLDRFCNQQLATASPSWTAPALEGKVFAASCTECRVRRWCYGVWKVYADRHGLEEFRPITSTGVSGSAP
ncbi:MAG TPA: radical SAM protein [Myxococcota bacterium]|nr:radical SAM protein [Myxococcota bacterium]HOH76726.1 radical SAM protein [Myxococcota bacterium]